MIFYDGVVFRLQEGGGISILFKEIMSRVPERKMYLDLVCNPRFLERYRDVHVPNGFDIFHSTYYRIPKNKNLKVVTTVHDFTYELYSSRLKRSVHSWQKNRAILASDKIICVSENTKKDLLKFVKGVDEEKIHVVYNGVAKCYHPLSVDSCINQVLFVGARGGYKNFSNLVEALRGFSDVSLLCVGGGGFSKDEYYHLESAIPGRYKYAGYISNDELNIEYNKSICLVYPSVYEGFGIPVLEAMRAGCPVVAMNSSSIPEVSGQAAYLMDSGNASEIAEAISFFQVKANREYFQNEGYLQSKKFGWEKTFEETMRIYRELGF